jgi:drug/metabolite transporter (DMT)-like permease
MQRLMGVCFIIVSGISFGTMPIFARLAYGTGVTPVTLLFLRFGIASVIMLLLTLTMGLTLPRGAMLSTTILMGAGYATQAFCYFTALTLASAGLVALLLYLYPVIVTILAVVIIKEPFSKRKTQALGLALIGTALTIGPSGGGKPLGIILSLASAHIYAVYILVGSKMKGQGTAIQSSTMIMVSAAIVSGGLVMIQGPSFPSTLSGWVSVGAIALVSTVLAMVAFLAGLERVGPTNAATLSTIEPVVTVILAALILGETMSPLLIVGGLMILVAVIALARAESSKLQTS